MEADNRPLGSEHPHPVSVLQDGDQWVTSQWLNSPLLQAVPPVLPRGRGWAIPSSSFWVKHCTTSVYSSHDICCGLRPSQWGQPPRLSRRWLIKTHIARVSQTANPMVIGPLHTPRLGGKCGEVKPDSFTCGHLLGNFARYQSRPRLPLRKEDRTMALHLGGFPSGAGPACPALVTTFGAPSFPREASSLRPVAYPTHSVPTSLRMVSNQRSSSDPGQPGSRDPGFHSLVENSFESPQRNPTRIPSVVEAFLFTDSSAVGWGAHMDKRTASGRWSEAMKELHINVLELNAIWLGIQAFEDTLHDSNVAIMCENVSDIAYLRNQGGTRSQQMCRMAIDTCEWAEERSMTLIPRHLPGHLNVLADHLSRRDQILKTEWSLNPAVARRVLGQSTCGSVCTQVQHQTSNLHVSDSRTGGLESRQSSPIMGRSVRLRVPTNGSDQTDSEQVNLAQSGADPHSPPLAETGMVSGPPTTVHSFPVGTSTNSKVAKEIILSSLSSDT